MDRLEGFIPVILDGEQGRILLELQPRPASVSWGCAGFRSCIDASSEAGEPCSPALRCVTMPPLHVAATLPAPPIVLGNLCPVVSGPLLQEGA